MRLLSLFSGIGAFEKALENLGEPVDLVNYCEIDKYASKAFALIHNVDESKNLRDVCSVNTSELPKDIDLITYGFPCQDISNAGKQRGFANEDGQLTRSGLFFEALRIIEETKPKIAIAENVKALTSKRFTSEFNTVLTCLNQAGYQNYWSVLNAKDFGIPQNRERVFIISIRNDIAHGFNFPQKQELKLRLRDMLEDDVDEKYFLSEKIQSRFRMTDATLSNNVIGTTKPNSTRFGERDLVYNPDKIMGALAASDYKQPKQILNGARIIRLFNVLGYEKSTNFAGNVYDKEGLSPTLQTAQGGHRQPMVIEDSKEKSKDGCILVGSLNKEGWHDFSNRVYSPDGIARTLMAVGGGANEKAGQYLMPDSRIRKLTPKECFRLMGFDDKDCDILVENRISNTQLYKMAGNSIVVDVLENIFKSLSVQYKELFSNSLKTEKSQQLVTWDVRSDWQSRQITIFDILN